MIASFIFPNNEFTSLELAEDEIETIIKIYLDLYLKALLVQVAGCLVAINIRSRVWVNS